MDESKPQKKPHISPSQMDMFFRCGEQYRRRYVLGEIVPPGVALVKGSAVHKAAEVNYRQKVETHVDLALSDLTDAAATDVTHRVAAEGLMLTPEESSVGLARTHGIVVSARDSDPDDSMGFGFHGLSQRQVAGRILPLTRGGIGNLSAGSNHVKPGKLGGDREEWAPPATPWDYDERRLTAFLRPIHATCSRGR
jgi:hypothetical protein